MIIWPTNRGEESPKACYFIVLSILCDSCFQKKDLWWYMNCTKLKQLQLCEAAKIGYTYKCMGAGFWALKQKDFQKAMIKVVMAVSRQTVCWRSEIICLWLPATCLSGLTVYRTHTLVRSIVRPNIQIIWWLNWVK